MSCPVCGRINTRETGAPFPTDNTRFIRYCLQLQLNIKSVEKGALICFDHFDRKDQLLKEGQVVGVTRTAVPKKRIAKEASALSNAGPPPKMTLEQLLAKNVEPPNTSTANPIPAPHQPNVASSVNFNFQNAQPNFANTTTAMPEMSIFGFPRDERRRAAEFQQSWPQHSATTSSAGTTASPLNELAKRTLVVYRRKREGSLSPSIDQKYFREWVQRQFNVPNSAFQEVSQTQHVSNYFVVYMVFHEAKTLENILQMYRSSSEPVQCVLSSATDVLLEWIRTEELGSNKAPPNVLPAYSPPLFSTQQQYPIGANLAIPAPMQLLMQQILSRQNSFQSS